MANNNLINKTGDSTDKERKFMNINDTFKHKHIEHLFCKIVAFTKKGFKIHQYDYSQKKTKKVTQYWDRILWDGAWASAPLPNQSN